MKEGTPDFFETPVYGQEEEAAQPEVALEDMTHEELLVFTKGLMEKTKILERDLIHDGLTGLKTRAFLKTELDTYASSQESHSREKRKEGYSHASLLFIDIDHFKFINDSFGHGAGDVVLSAVAEAIESRVRGNDVVARWGGEEMAALLYGADEDEASNKADEIREHIESLSFDVLGDRKVTVSIGVANIEEGEDGESALARADKALYEAKGSGRNKVVRHSNLRSL
jgi:diguanylate cyclase (GGDEF)-like protein